MIKIILLETVVLIPDNYLLHGVIFLILSLLPAVQITNMKDKSESKNEDKSPCGLGLDEVKIYFSRSAHVIVLFILEFMSLFVRSLCIHQ